MVTNSYQNLDITVMRRDPTGKRGVSLVLVFTLARALLPFMEISWYP